MSVIVANTTQAGIQFCAKQWEFCYEFLCVNTNTRL